jgi:hypothetical protein
MSAAWTLVPALVSLHQEFNELAPEREHSSDGSIGDPRHADSSSDHNPDETGRTPSEDADNINEVHAIDVDKDLRRADFSMERAVQIIVARHRNGLDDRLQNVIYDRRIWSRSWDWTQRPYTGPNPHDHHAHFSARYTTAQERDTRPWGLLEADMALSDQDKTWLKLAVQDAAREAVVGVLRDGYTAAIGRASAPTAGDKAKRNIRDFVRALTGGPTEDDIEAAKQSILDAVGDKPQA